MTAVTHVLRSRPSNRRVGRLATLLCILGASVFGSAQTFRLSNLGTLAGGESRPTAINAAGKVTLFNAVAGNYRAFLQDETRIDLGTLGGAQAYASGLNDTDRVVGYAEKGGGVTHAFVWTPGGSGGDPGNPQMRGLGTLGGGISEAYAINAAGHVTGYAENGSNARAFLFDGSTMIDIGRFTGQPNSFGYDINDLGHVAGTAYDKNYRRPMAFLYRDNAAVDLGALGGKEASALALNDGDQVVGYSSVAGGTEHAFLYENGQMIDLGTLGGDWSYALDINDQGAVVGGSFIDSANLIYHPFLYDRGSMVDLNDELDSTGLGWELLEAYGINNSGQIVGLGVFQGYDHIFLLTPTTQLPPEITLQPVDGTVDCRLTATFEVAAMGESLTYQWYRGLPPSGLPLNGANEPKLMLPAATPEQSGPYYAVVTNPHGTVTSSVCTLDVVDSSPPLITGCPPDLTLYVEPGTTGASVTWPLPEATDACEGSLPVYCEPATGSWFAVGTTQVDCVARDLSGNTSLCRFSVTIRVIPSPPDITQLTYEGSELTLGFETSADIEYWIETADDLIRGDWESLTPAIRGTGQPATVTLLIAPEEAHRFYRVNLILP